MSTFPPATAPVRSPDAVNADIRALWQCSGGRLSPEGEATYQRLLVEWASAMHADMAEAA
ncbi:hypothetical protein [Streptomyces sp. NPDC060184]|uniref:hypothetical protein n=1 Tax=Streptomyces sp. NPDC060184 TaxID=3347064 RepID=UPI00364C87A9